MDLMNQPPSGEHYNKFVLLFDKTAGDAKVHYMLIDPGKKTRLVPKVSSISMPRLKDRIGFRVISHNNCLYIMGGRNFESGNYLDSVMKFDPVTNVWTRRAPMIRPRTRFTVNVLDNNLIVTGGESKGGKLIGNVELYDPLNNIWAEVAPLPRPRADHASCMVDGKLIVSGGLSNLKFQCSNIFWQYDPQKDKWSEVYKDGGLPFDREKHAMVAFRRKMYVIGGVGIDKKTNSEKDMDTMSAYEFIPGKAGKWALDLPPMMYARCQFGTFQLGHHIYVVGGHNFNKNEDTIMIEYYNTKKKRWRDVFVLGEGGFVNIDACILRIPQSNKEFSNLGIVMYDKWILW